ncbi:musculin-like [Macrobrachium nipponense]|uniref:musculin-like n=1 Tax=Macrobrachium nipponense TaxID=159736 RepID=UPI0030C81280
MPRRRKDNSEGGGGTGGGGGGRVREKPVQRNAANARERARMRILSRAFSRLKTTLPWVPADTKLSKLDTLRLATSYIAHLRALLQDDAQPRSQTHPLALTWPFSFQRANEPASGAMEVTSDQNDSYATHCNNATTTTINHMNTHHMDRYFGDDLPDYDYYPSELLHIA